MNGNQQREHRTHLAQIEAEASRALIAAAQRLEALGKTVADAGVAHGNLVRAVSDLALDHGVTRGLVDGTGSAFIAFTRRGFWSRLNWLITGR